jgi:hypothetical protein
MLSREPVPLSLHAIAVLWRRGASRFPSAGNSSQVVFASIDSAASGISRAHITGIYVSPHCLKLYSSLGLGYSELDSSGVVLSLHRTLQGRRSLEGLFLSPDPIRIFTVHPQRGNQAFKLLQFGGTQVTSHSLAYLKVPKCENFHRTDFFYFFSIKPLWVGDFRAKIKNSKFWYWGCLLGVYFSKILC